MLCGNGRRKLITTADDQQHIALLDEPAILRRNFRPCANLDYGQRSANYSERRLGCGYGVSGASITRRWRARFPSSCGGRTLQATNCVPAHAVRRKRRDRDHHVGVDFDQGNQNSKCLLGYNNEAAPRQGGRFSFYAFRAAGGLSRTLRAFHFFMFPSISSWPSFS
jgi:hypothetical protein